MSASAETAQRAKIVATDHGGIFPPYEAFYIQGILYASQRSLAAFGSFEMLASSSAQADQVFAAIQEALTHAAALSRFFWPAKKTEALAVARSRRLREAFDLDDRSPLRWRRLRNALEHYDKDLDVFLLGDPRGRFRPDPVVEDAPSADDVDDVFKLVDPVKEVCVILGQRFEFAPIRGEVTRVSRMATDKTNQGWRL